METLEQLSNLGWGTEDGGITSYVLHVQSAYFSTDSRYQDNQSLLLHLIGPAADEEGNLSEGDPKHEMWPCGKGWQSDDNVKAYHVDRSPKKQFNKKSWVGMFIERIIDPKNKNFIKGLGQALIDRYGKPNQYDASIYSKLILKLDKHEEEFGTDKETGKVIKSSRLLPTAFLGFSDGWVKGGSNNGNGAAKAAVKASKPAAPAPVETDDEEVDEEGGDANALDTLLASLPKVLRSKLSAMARKSDTADVFEGKALEVDEVTNNDELTDVVVSGALYEALRAA